MKGNYLRVLMFLSVENFFKKLKSCYKDSSMFDDIRYTFSENFFFVIHRQHSYIETRTVKLKKK